MGAAAVRRLRLQILRFVVAGTALGMLMRAATADPVDTALTQGARLVFAAASVGVLVRATADTAHLYGTGVVLLAKVATTLRATELLPRREDNADVHSHDDDGGDDDGDVRGSRCRDSVDGWTAAEEPLLPWTELGAEADPQSALAAPRATGAPLRPRPGPRTYYAASPLLTLVVFGSNRVTPLAAAVFGGALASVGVAAWAVAESVYFYAADTTRAGSLRITTARCLPCVDDAGVLLVEVLYIFTVTLIACAVERGYRRALMQLSEALDARQQFINNMNHEIRTPLVGVIGMADILLLQELPSTLATQLKIIHDSGNALLAIVNSILDVSKLSANMLRIDLRPFDVRAMLATGTNTFRALAYSSKLRYELKIDPAMPAMLVSDGTRLLQILGNLTGNAFKFTERGEVLVSAGFAAEGVDDLEQLLRPRPFEHATDADGGGDSPASPPALLPHSSDVVAAMTVCAPRSSRLATTPAAASDAPATSGRKVMAALARLAAVFDRRTPPYRPGSSPPRATSSSPALQRQPVLWIKVADTGIGMSAQQAPLVIEPFRQADNSLTRPYSGSGLGLSICHELVQMLGGAMVYASHPGVGCIFLIAVPCRLTSLSGSSSSSSSSVRATQAGLGDGAAEASPPSSSLHAQPRLEHLPMQLRSGTAAALQASRTAPPSPRPPARPTASGGALDAALPSSPVRPLIVIADDNAINIQVLRRQLHHLGCDTITASNGRECVDLVAHHLQASGAPAASRIDAIFMDLHMPVMDGMDATRAIRRLEAGRSHAARPSAIPIVAVTADDPALQEAACVACGMNDFLRKPIVLGDLRQLLVRLGLPDAQSL